MVTTRGQNGITPRYVNIINRVAPYSPPFTKSESQQEHVETPSRKKSIRRSASSTRTQTLTPPPEQDSTSATRRVNASTSTKSPSKKTTRRVVDGWEVGTDPKIDQNPHYEFGGSLGVTVMMIGFPLLMYYMWIGATYYDGGFPRRSSSDESWSHFARHLLDLAYTGAFPSLRAWTIYWVFFIMQSIFYLTLPGVYTKGKPLPHMDGKQLTYFCNGAWAFYVTIAIGLVAHVTGVFKLYTLIDEFGPLMSVAILSGYLVSIVAYVSALARGAQHRMTGSILYDFFMGAELNPRAFQWLDFKMFFEIRLPWFILFFVSLGGAARQYEQNGYVSGEMAFLLMAHWLYANACCKGEEMIPTTWYLLIFFPPVCQLTYQGHVL